MNFNKELQKLEKYINENIPEYNKLQRNGYFVEGAPEEKHLRIENILDYELIKNLNEKDYNTIQNMLNDKDMLFYIPYNTYLYNFGVLFLELLRLDLNDTYNLTEEETSLIIDSLNEIIKNNNLEIKEENGEKIILGKLNDFLGLEVDILKEIKTENFVFLHYLVTPIETPLTRLRGIEISDEQYEKWFYYMHMTPDTAYYVSIISDILNIFGYRMLELSDNPYYYQLTKDGGIKTNLRIYRLSGDLSEFDKIYPDGGEIVYYPYNQ